ncbi:hypothetical protein C0Q70_00886 [Pomacea canaliculata]|uniref:Secreted protein n=1 Tax=Pomacea canaliculata TaxID=400727 RepID=A0A2T7PXW9_POMCA|nr:hypothetical protein C0Q70_00886 [Pomacea canaliculata]
MKFKGYFHQLSMLYLPAFLPALHILPSLPCACARCIEEKEREHCSRGQAGVRLLNPSGRQTEGMEG